VQLPYPSPDEADVLFFGCRNQEADYFFQDEWNVLAAQTGLTVFPAFSRDQVRYPAPKNPPCC
jgi:sulfite reductase alpha subunit-like flavoprotein